MASERYLKTLKEAGVHDVQYLSNRHSNDTVLFASILSTKDIKEPLGGRSDYMLSFYLSDPSIYPGSVNTCIFLNKREPLELIKNADFIAIENFQLKMFNRQPQFVINRFSRFATYKSNSFTCTFNKSYNAGPFNEKILKALDTFEKQKQTMGHKVAVPTPRSILETDQIEDDKSRFFDYVGQVIDLTFKNERATITLTDYTLNPKPIMYTVDESIVRKDYIIMCTVWDSLVAQCANLIPGDYVYLRNCVKKNSHPLEFSIRNEEDEKKICIEKIEQENYPRLITLIQRKTEYIFTKEKKRKRDQSFPPLSTAFRNVPRVLTSIKDVIESEEPSVLFRVKAYVADYEPKDIKKWIQGWCEKCLLPSSAGERCAQCEGETEFIYQLSLLLKDEELELKVNLFHESAKELFQIVPAKIAFENETEISKLEKIMALARKDVLYMEFGLSSGRVKDKKIYQFARTSFILEEDELDIQPNKKRLIK